MSNFAVASKHSHPNWSTPKELYDELNAEFNFNDDPCPLYGKEQGLDGLSREWGARTYINPPYTRKEIGRWVKKAYDESLKGKIVVALLRCDPSTKWFRDYIDGKAEVRLVLKRLKFGDAKHGAAFASMVIVWGQPDPCKQLRQHINELRNATSGKVVAWQWADAFEWVLAHYQFGRL